MRTKFLALVAIGLLAIVAAMPLPSNSSPVRAATDDEIEVAVRFGLSWLADQQKGDGYFESTDHTLNYPAAATCLALVKFEERGWELYPRPAHGPFDEGYEYYDPTVIDGLDYVFRQMVSDADGIHVEGGDCSNKSCDVYNTGICMMAVAASREPSRVTNVLGTSTGSWTYREVLQGMLRWMEDAQNDGTAGHQCDLGGWGYPANHVGWSDNSVSGYATLGIGSAIAPAYGFGLKASPTVIEKLKTFVAHIQDYPDDPAIGPSDYEACGYRNGWYNILKTGNLLYEMKLIGKQLQDATVQAAVTYIGAKFDDTATVIWNEPVGWRLDSGGGVYQAMFTMMKGLQAYGIDELLVWNGPVGTVVDWFDEVSTYIVTHQVQLPGYWTGVGEGADDWVLATSWALLTLERAAPSPPAPQHYKCYEIAGQPPGVSTWLDTQFGNHQPATLGAPTLLCPPALKDGQGDLTLPDLKCYDIVGGETPGEVWVNLWDQFGEELDLPVERAERLCLPANKTEVVPPSPTPPPSPSPEATVGPPQTCAQSPGPSPAVPSAPYYKCYRILGAPSGAVVKLQTQFGVEESVQVGAATSLCTPALMCDQGSLDFPDLKCYEISGDDPDAVVDLATGLGVERNVDVGPAKLLCVEALKVAHGIAIAVGGTTELAADGSGSARPADGSGPSAPLYAAIAGAAAAAVAALTAGASYARRRWLR